MVRLVTLPGRFTCTLGTLVRVCGETGHKLGLRWRARLGGAQLGALGGIILTQWSSWATSKPGALARYDKRVPGWSKAFPNLAAPATGVVFALLDVVAFRDVAMVTLPPSIRGVMFANQCACARRCAGALTAFGVVSADGRRTAGHHRTPSRGADNPVSLNVRLSRTGIGALGSHRGAS